MNQPFNLLELESIINALLSEGKCACHIINPHKTRILMWKLVQNGHTTYYLRIGIQKFISQEQTDRNGETYWRYYSYEIKKEEVNKVPGTGSPTDPVTKFNQRQEKAINHERNPENHQPEQFN